MKEEIKNIVAKYKHINNVDDVKNFINDVYSILHLNFHPDTPFNDYINLDTDQPTFNVSESNALDNILDQCFLYCEKNNLDIYEIGLEIQNKYSIIKNEKKIMKNFNHYLKLVKENKLTDNTFEDLRHVTVTYDTGDVIPTSMNANLSDDEIKDYFKIGKVFNLGAGGNDRMGKVTDVIINESFKDFPYGLYWSDGIRQAKGFKTINNALNFANALTNVKDWEIFKQSSGFHSTDQEQYLELWHGEGSYWYNRSQKEPALKAKEYKHGMNENINSTDIRNILIKYTDYLIDNQIIEKQINVAKHINIFLGITESNDTYNYMSFVIPSIDKWIKVKGEFEGQEKKAIKFLDKTWMMDKTNEELLSKNIGKTVKFKYNSNKNIMLMPTIVN